MSNKVRICLSGDNHLGKRQYNSKIREEDFQKAWFWVCDEVSKANPDFFIMSGDLFDKKQMDPVTLPIAKYGLAQAGGLSKVIAIEGNHDGRSFIQKGRSWLEYLYESGYVDHILRPGKSFSSCGVSFFGAPWSGRSTVDAFENALWEVEAECGNTRDFTVGVFHAAPESYVMGVGSIPPELLRRDSFDLVLLGHCHRSFSINDRIICAGSPEICDVAEVGQNGGLWIIDIDMVSSKVKTELIQYNHRNFATYSVRGEAVVSEAWSLPFQVEPGFVIFIDVIGDRVPIDISELKRKVEKHCDPLIVRINDRMTARMTARKKSGGDFIGETVADLLDLLGSDVSRKEFESVFDCFVSDDIDGVIPILLEATNDN